MQVNVNGTNYDSWEAVPPEARAQLAAGGFFVDADGNGIPDLFEGKLPPNLSAMVPPPNADGTPQVVTASSFAVNGQSYPSFGSLPSEVQEAMRSAGLGAMFTGTPGAAPFAAHGATEEPARDEHTGAIQIGFGGSGKTIAVKGWLKVIVLLLVALIALVLILGVLVLEFL